jgi:hypothetical protein
MESAPTDGTPIVGLVEGEEVEVRWAESRVCMLAGLSLGAGSFGEGWEDTLNGLYSPDPDGWRPVEAAGPVGKRATPPVRSRLHPIPES